jgi:hypothetical protein
MQLDQSILPELSQGPGARGCRDRELALYVGRFGIVSIDHVATEFGISRTAAYRRVARCIEGGLLERLEVLRGEPNVLRATRAGLKYAGLEMKVAAVSPATVTHWLRCATVAQRHIDISGPKDRLITVRELPSAERRVGEAIGKAKIPFVGGRADKPRWHTPDLVVLKGPETHAFEVELTPKAPRRLTAIMEAWAFSPWVHKIIYLCAPGQTYAAVKRAVDREDISKRVHVAELPS